jgi:hypothetical protein
MLPLGSGCFSLAVFGGSEILMNEFDLEPDAISGVCSSSPLAIKRNTGFTDLPILQCIESGFRKIFNIIG